MSGDLLSQSNPKTRRNLPLPAVIDVDAEVIALSPKALMTTNRFICEICKKGFKRDQNLQLHRRGHNLPWKLKQRANKDQIKRKLYICPENTCVHHHPSRALGDLTGIKKHFSRKHGEKNWKCEKCCKKYAVQSDWKAHSKTCGTREYKCHCGTLFSRKDSFVTHRAFCDALAEERINFINSDGFIDANSILNNNYMVSDGIQMPPPPEAANLYGHLPPAMMGSPFFSQEVGFVNFGEISELGGDLTRDFLGMSGDDGGAGGRALEVELAKVAMGLRHYTGNG